MQKLQEQIPVKTKSCAIIAVIHELSGLVLYLILSELFSQGTTINAKISGSSGLIVIAVPQHGLEHRLLNFGDYSFEQVTGNFSVQIGQVPGYCRFDRLL